MRGYYQRLLCVGVMPPLPGSGLASMGQTPGVPVWTNHDKSWSFKTTFKQNENFFKYFQPLSSIDVQHLLAFWKCFKGQFLVREVSVVNGFGHAQTESWRAHDHTSEPQTTTTIWLKDVYCTELSHKSISTIHHISYVLYLHDSKWMMNGSIQIYGALPLVSGFFITAQAHIEAKYNQSMGENVPSPFCQPRSSLFPNNPTEDGGIITTKT